MSKNRQKQIRKTLREQRKRWVRKSKRTLGRRMTSAEMRDLITALKTYAKRAQEKRQFQ